MNVVVIAPHPDDETLGCGGTLLKHIDQGDNVFWLIVTSINKDERYSVEKQSQRASIIKKVQKAYQFKDVECLEIPTCNVHAYDFNSLIEKMSKFMNKVKPEIVYTVNRGDVHTDHQIIAQAVWSCTKTFRYPFVKKILMYETVSETEYSAPLQENLFIPNVYSDITDYMRKKLEILKMYEGEIAEVPFPRSIENVEALATYRGCSVNVRYAEAFMLVKEIF